MGRDAVGFEQDESPNDATRFCTWDYMTSWLQHRLAPLTSFPIFHEVKPDMLFFILAMRPNLMHIRARSHK